jgi:hypothetical protein
MGLKCGTHNYIKKKKTNPSILPNRIFLCLAFLHLAPPHIGAHVPSGGASILMATPRRRRPATPPRQACCRCPHGSTSELRRRGSSLVASRTSTPSLLPLLAWFYSGAALQWVVAGYQTGGHASTQSLFPLFPSSVPPAQGHAPERRPHAQVGSLAVEQ